MAVSLTATGASIVVAAYVLDTVGLSFEPTLALLLALVAGTVVLTWCGLTATWDRQELTTFMAIVSIVFAWLMWLARPSFLPLGGGPDLTHHLLLVQYIERHWRLVHGPGVEDYLGEMVYYTPGSHILTALAGAWLRTTGVHALHGVMAAAAALKTGFVYLLAMRALPAATPRIPLAAIAAVALFASPTFFLGSFTEFSFLAQVVAELFAVAMWWTLAAWDDVPRWSLAGLAGLLGSAAFLTWPVLLGPPFLLLAVLIVLPRSMAFRSRIAHAAVAVVPVALIAALFIPSRFGMMIIVGTGGRAVWPTMDAYGAYGLWFLAAAGAGFAVSLFRRHARTTVIVAATTALQGAVLYWFARRHANEPYMALKMLYFFLYPQAVAVAAAIGTVWRGLAMLVGAPRMPLDSPRTMRLESRLAWALTLAVAVFVARPLWGAPRRLSVERRPAISNALAQAGSWARAHVPIKCVEYLVGNSDSAYWLHLAVLGNARQGGRTADRATYELTPALVRWLTPGGLPYAIVDLPAVPSDVRSQLDIVARFETAAIAKRRGPGACPEDG